MGNTKRQFTIKLNPGIIKVARMALVHAQVDTTYTPSLHALKIAAGITGRLSLELDEALILQGALNLYAEQEIQDGSESHKIATHFSAALGDFVVTKVTEPVAPPTKKIVASPNTKTVGGPIPVNQELERRLERKRDEIFQHIIGTPADMTVWGTPRLKKEPKAKSRMPANLQPNRVRTLDGIVPNRPRQRLASVADQDVDDTLTQGRVPAYNEQMKREGAEELINASQNRGANQQGLVVGQVHSHDHDVQVGATGSTDERFQEQLRTARDNKDTAAEVQMLSSLWATT
jgi:hypothetical protein